MQLDRKAGMATNYRGWTSAGLAVNISEWTCQCGDGYDLQQLDR